MNKSMLIIAILILQITLAFAISPEIQYLKMDKVYPDQLQLTWSVIDDDGLAKLYVYKDDKEVYKEELTGNKNVGLYQTTNDNRSHVFKLTVVDVTNLYSSETKTTTGDIASPTIISPSKIYSNKKIFSFKTSEPATCKIGFSETSLVKDTVNETINHSIEIPFKEGINRLLVKCADSQDNEMEGFLSVDYVYDITGPGKVSNISFEKKDGKTKMTWNAAVDSNGIDYYIIYNNLKAIGVSNYTYWYVNTNDSIFFVSAADLAGNEGSKQEYNLVREVLLQPNASANNTEEVIIEANTTAIENKNNISNTSRIAWIIFGLLAVVFICWKIYEHKTDKHGLKKYMKTRRKMRELDYHHRS